MPDTNALALPRRSPFLAKFVAQAAPMRDRAMRAFDRGFAAVQRTLAMPRVWLGAVMVLLSLQSWLTLSHDPWLDEWQALQIAVQSPTLSALFENLHYEGHPPLWYFILRGAALIVPVFWVLPVVQWFIAMATQALILSRAPFGRLERLLFGASYFILFEFGAVSRSLALGALIAIAFFAARRRRTAWLLTAILPMVDFQYGLLSLILLILLWRDGRWWWPGACLWALSGCLAAITVIPAHDMIPALDIDPFTTGLRRLVGDFSAMLIPFHTRADQIAWDGGLPFNLDVVAGPLFLLFAISQANHVRLHGQLFRAFLYTTIAFSLTIYPFSVRHLTLVPLLLILLKWREVERGGELDATFRGWLVAIAAGGLAVSVISAVVPFDTASLAAAEIRARNLQDKQWAAWPDSTGQGVAALLGREVHTLRKGCTQSFIRWNFRDGIDTPKDLKVVLHQLTRQYGRFYLMTPFALSVSDPHELKLIAKIPRGYDGYPFGLYEVAPDAPELANRPPPCAPARRPLDNGTIWTR